jgi:hypothetical protein
MFQIFNFRFLSKPNFCYGLSLLCIGSFFLEIWGVLNLENMMVKNKDMNHIISLLIFNFKVISVLFQNSHKIHRNLY